MGGWIEEGEGGKLGQWYNINNKIKGENLMVLFVNGLPPSSVSIYFF